jgi:carboxypeptidase C (cathepsin A)
VKLHLAQLLAQGAILFVQVLHGQRLPLVHPADRKLRVFIAHGWNDLACPFMGSVLTVDQMPTMGDATSVSVHEYPGGHMFYNRPDSASQFRKDVLNMYTAARRARAVGRT